MQYLILLMLISTVQAATNLELEQHFTEALKLYNPKYKKASFKKYQKCLTDSCPKLKNLYSFKPTTQDDQRTTYTKLLAKPKPAKKTLKKKVDLILESLKAEQIWNLRFKKLRSRTYILRACGFPEIINPNKTIQEAKKTHNTALLECMEGKMVELATKHEENRVKEVNWKKNRKILREFDCSTLTKNFDKLVCNHFKR